MLIYILIGLAALVVLVLIIAATRPNTFEVSRSIGIKAPPEKIFPLINDFHAWPAWSPWEKLEPTMTRTHSGAATGKGAVYAWDGKKVGSGRMEITDTKAPSMIAIKLDFFKPFEAHNTTVYTMERKGDATNVNWAMSGNHNFMSKVMCLFVTMDKMVGKDFEAGLANMKAVAEK